MTIAEELIAIQPAQRPAIVTRQIRGGWVASIANNSSKERAWGATESEAIGTLHLLCQDVLGLVQREEP